MGLLVDGNWVDKWYDTASSGGTFVRSVAGFRSCVERGGEHPPERGRYRLYVAGACPWAHRVRIMRALKGLEAYMDVTLVAPRMLDHGWTFAQPEPERQASCLHEIYTAARPDYTGRVTVPVLWDRLAGTIVSNESSEIMRMFNVAFDHETGNTLDVYPEHLRADIDAVNDWVYHGINNGVYRSGFATTQAAYNDAVDELFDALDRAEAILATQPFLVGDHLTEADLRLVVTLLRFDLVYVTHFKCDRRRVVDYPNLWNYTRQLYQLQAIRGTFVPEAVREHYFCSHPTINPHAIISTGPVLDFDTPHNRDSDPLSAIFRREASVAAK